MLCGRFLGSLVLLSLVSSPALADEFIYKSTNKIDFIKLDRAKKEEREGGLKHPYPFGPEQIRATIRSIHFNKKILLIKDIQDRQLFSEANVEFLAPYLIEAFGKAKPEEVVVVSYFTRDTKVVIQDDRLTVFRAFVKEDGLHIRFTKLYAKMLGDRTTMGAERATREARGMRVALELQPGQNRISWRPEELVFDLAYFASGEAGEEKKLPLKNGKGKKEARGIESEGTGKSVKDRLQELDQLKKSELITEKEYRKKRRELIEQL